MNEHDGPVYEVTLNIDREAAHDLDEWLASHVDDMLAIPGFIEAKTYALEDEGDRVRRVVYYYVESDAHLEQYLDGPAQQLRQSTSDKYGDRVAIQHRVLRDPAVAEQSLARVPRCLNCDAPLTGQYCGKCGQRARSRLISLWELFRDAFGDLFELDSRLWRTLIPLAVRPGRLTRDYLRGRQARFMPPFRTYLVLSLAFFLIAFFDPREDLGILFEAEPSAEELDEESTPSDEAGQAVEEVRRGLEEAGVVVEQPDEDDGISLRIDEGGLDSSCNLEGFDTTDMPRWLARRLTKERVQAMCERLAAEDGLGLQGFTDKLKENVPIGLFILLPMMALVLKILYPLSKRFYVEHLLLVVHYHAFIFLALTLQILIGRLGNLLRLPELVDDAVGLAVSLYIPIYLYKALRCVYGQGGLFTLVKLIVLLVTYLIGLILIIGFAALFAAFSI